MSKLNIDAMQGVEVPSIDWDITDVLDDIIMIQFVDCSADGEYIQRSGIYVKNEVGKQIWRVGKVLKSGPDCSDKIKPGVHVIFPNDKGIHVPKVGKHVNIAFLNEERIFGICVPNKNALPTGKTKGESRVMNATTGRIATR